MGRDPAPGETPIFCGDCQREIVACKGMYGDWMHLQDRMEACPAGKWARPETPAEMNERLAP